MPEIAEVETVRNTLKNKILNKVIKDVKILYPKIIENNQDEFISKIKNQKINDINRVGKWLLFILDDYAFLSHLRMEGKYFIKDINQPIEKHEHVIFTFTDNTDLRYHDTRKFGRMILVDKDKIYDTKEIKKQGFEPNDKRLTKEYLLAKIHNKKIPIKTLLLDQSIISGLGNIYANEVLYASRINPLRLGETITLEECQKIIDNANNIIKKAIEMGGTTIKSYTSSLGVTGRFQQYLQVHKRENEPCLNCHTKILNIKVNGRSTYYCPNCQK